MEDRPGQQETGESEGVGGQVPLIVPLVVPIIVPLMGTLLYSTPLMVTLIIPLIPTNSSLGTTMDYRAQGNG